VRKKPNDMCFHKDTVEVSTWNYVGVVDKNGYLTLKQKPKNNPTAQLSLSLLQFMEIPKTKTTT
jgi:hypothetical protein